MIINDFEVKRILVDSRSSVDILCLDAFEKMHLERKDLQPTNIPLTGFIKDVVRPLGRIKVQVAVGSDSNLVCFEHHFLEVTTLPPYNAILGQPILHALRVVVSTYYLSVKFPTRYGVRVVRGDQLESRKCYAMVLKGKGKLANDVDLESPPENTDERACLMEDTVLLPISNIEP
ncbi:PREDICTED: uncharacterized protein LOC104596275 [Nelumbo nucifera]|uniref:Uncharacterized protein LOC104596275 n=1 Tax=Nelumbo nucifera TaxID=4432 RepID=A0A1U7ZNH4_NELNU|nr:PREDICTED: uncharacterized protein LOC104596275 [Nelumbo nucifera]